MVSPEGIYGSCGPVSPHLKPDTSVNSWRETKFLTNNLTIAQSQYHCPIPSLPNLIIIAQSQHCPISTVLPDLIIIDQPHNCPISSTLPNLIIIVQPTCWQSFAISVRSGFATFAFTNGVPRWKIWKCICFRKSWQYFSGNICHTIGYYDILCVRGQICRHCFVRSLQKMSFFNRGTWVKYENIMHALFGRFYIFS